MASLNGEDQEVKREEMTKVTKEVTVNEEKDFEIEDDKSKEEMTTKAGGITMNENVVEECTKIIDEKNMNGKKNDDIEEEVKMEVEIKTGVSFPVKLNDGKQLNTMGIRKKKILALGVNIYAFGIYADNEKMKEVLKAKFEKAPEKANKELYDAVINSDVGMTVRLVIVYGSLTMSMVRKNFDEGLGASLKKLNGGQKNEDLVNKVMGAAKDTIKLPSGSIIEISRMPNHVLHMYLGDDPFDKDAKERFGASLLSLF